MVLTNEMNAHNVIKIKGNCIFFLEINNVDDNLYLEL